jgi:hypothetical protein
MWKANVGGAGRLLDVLASRYPDAITREELAQACDVTASGGTFSTYLSRLRPNGLIENTNPTDTDTSRRCFFPRHLSSAGSNPSGTLGGLISIIPSLLTLPRVLPAGR